MKSDTPFIYQLKKYHELWLIYFKSFIYFSENTTKAFIQTHLIKSFHIFIIYSNSPL